ncbi:ribonuclease [Pasteurellaceae bacterium Macca]|nr:ribonuclease [Pasteurellaceae bacterium Macca]
MTQKNRNPKRPLNQLLTLGAVAIISVITWFNNERKSEPTPTNTPTTNTQKSSNGITIPDHLGHYDTRMAQDKYGKNVVATDYYMLSLSWSPSFCEAQKKRNQGKIPAHLQFQCEQAAQLGWVIHGLWPQSASARGVEDHPRFCQGDLPELPASLIKQYMTEVPGASLLQGEWEKHGACAFDRAEAYFAKQKALFKSLNLPGSELSQRELFQWMKKFNPSLKNVHLKARGNELYICYDKQWNAIDCP